MTDCAGVRDSTRAPPFVARSMRLEPRQSIQSVGHKQKRSNAQYFVSTQTTKHDKQKSASGASVNETGWWCLSLKRTPWPCTTLATTTCCPMDPVKDVSKYVRGLQNHQLVWLAI